MIRCDYCEIIWPFFSSSFKCLFNNNEFRKSNLKRVLCSLALLEETNEISDDFYFEIKKNMKIQWEKAKNDKYPLIFQINYQK